MDIKTKKETPAQSMSIVGQIKEKPWEFKVKPFKILDNVYYVGNSWVGAYLIDTGEGLILLDSCFKEVQWMLFDAIREVGFDPADIKYLLLSHAHFDHIGGARFIQEVSDCKILIGKDDYFMIEERPELQIEEVAPFRIDGFYDYDNSFTMGNVVIRPVHTPGHTPGCTSIFIETTYQGKKYTLATHGGLGGSILTKKMLNKLNLPMSLQQDYLDGLYRIAEMKVDVFLPMHKGYFNIMELAEQDDGSGKAFIQPDLWRNVMLQRAAMFEQQLREEAEEESEQN